MTIAKNVSIVGSGPAGLMAAEIIAAAGHNVTVYDQIPSAGRKFLMAGRGGLNLTHSEPLDVFITRYGTASEWLAPYIKAFTPAQLRQWCEELGQDTFIGSSGRVFPKALKAAPLLRAWLKRLDALGVRFAPRHQWLGFDGADLCFAHAGKTVTVKTDATLLALGGASWPRLGSDGGWVKLLQAQGIAITPLRPANCGFTVNWSEHFRERFAGQPLKPVAISHNGVTRQGEAMITTQGIEGGVIYTLSPALRDALPTSITLDLRPDMKPQALARKLDAPRGSQSLSSYLRKCGFSPLAIGLLREMTSAEQLAQATPALLAKHFKALPLSLTGTTGIARAISSAGGIERSAVDEHLMLKEKPGVFVAGEMLDWEAPTGGYLLQGCFSTAVAAGQGLLRYL